MQNERRVLAIGRDREEDPVSMHRPQAEQAVPGLHADLWDGGRLMAAQTRATWTQNFFGSRKARARLSICSLGCTFGTQEPRAPTQILALLLGPSCSVPGTLLLEYRHIYMKNCLQNRLQNRSKLKGLYGLLRPVATRFGLLLSWCRFCCPGASTCVLVATVAVLEPPTALSSGPG